MRKTSKTKRKRPATFRDLTDTIARFEELAAEVGAPIKVVFSLVPLVLPDKKRRKR